MKKILFATILLLSLMVCAASLAEAGALADIKAGIAAANGDDYDKAITDHTKAIELNPRSPRRLLLPQHRMGEEGRVC